MSRYRWKKSLEQERRKQQRHLAHVNARVDAHLATPLEPVSFDNMPPGSARSRMTSDEYRMESIRPTPEARAEALRAISRQKETVWSVLFLLLMVLLLPLILFINGILDGITTIFGKTPRKHAPAAREQVAPRQAAPVPEEPLTLPPEIEELFVIAETTCPGEHAFVDTNSVVAHHPDLETARRLLHEYQEQHGSVATLHVPPSRADIQCDAPAYFRGR